MKNLEDSLRLDAQEEMEKHLDVLELSFKMSAEDYDLKDSFRRLHSVKALSQLLGMEEMTVMTHALESWMAPFFHGEASWNSSAQSSAGHIFTHLKNKYLNTLGHMLVSKEGDNEKFWALIGEMQGAWPKFTKNKKLQILMVDDELDYLICFKELLESTGNMEVTTEGGGHAALIRFRQTPFDVILTDYMMPGLNGLSFIQKIRELSQTPILMITSHKPEINLKRELLEHVYFLEKPFNLNRVQYYIQCSLALNKT